MRIIRPSDVPKQVDVLVVGGGPAGLGAVNAAFEDLDVLLVDAGKVVRHRDRQHPSDITAGLGGAGLFSDGKFSFFPASSALWSLRDRTLLRAAYHWATEALRRHGMDAPPFPEVPAVAGPQSGRWCLKDYPSTYLSLDARMDLTEGLVARGRGCCLSETRLVDCRWDSESRLLTARLSTAGAAPLEVRARTMVLATGRFGPLLLNQLSIVDLVFRRLEFGVRIEQDAKQAFFRDLEQLDPKLRFVSSNTLEWRTFCACRDGETVVSDTAGLWTVSGRADCPPSGRSNIGFNTRVLDPEVADRSWAHLQRSANRPEAFFRLPLRRVLAEERASLDRLHDVLGRSLVGYLVQGLRQLAEAYPSIDGDGAEIVGPTIEGVGWYPASDDHLAAPELPVWIAGDASGRFRGIVAGLVSGHYAASRCTRFLRDEPQSGASKTGLHGLRTRPT